jgi:hypothetical protein
MSRYFSAVPILALIAAAVAALQLAAADPSVPAARHPRPNPAYATQSTSRGAVARAYKRWGNTDKRDMTGAACEAHSVAAWAAILHTAATPKAVSRAVARSAEPAFRRGAYLGCLDALGG